MTDLARRKVSNNLMPEKIEINPLRRRSSLWTAQKISVKSPCLGKVVHGKR
jgi:hypothetical protein